MYIFKYLKQTSINKTKSSHFEKNYSHARTSIMKWLEWHKVSVLFPVIWGLKIFKVFKLSI